MNFRVSIAYPFCQIYFISIPSKMGILWIDALKPWKFSMLGFFDLIGRMISGDLKYGVRNIFGKLNPRFIITFVTLREAFF